MSKGSGLAELVAQIAERRPLHANFIEDAYRLLHEPERQEADLYMQHLLADHSMEYIAQSYETILDDTFEAQVFFMREGRYQHGSFKEVADAVYFNPDYMKRYMVGLAVTNYLWPNHVQIRRFFTETFPLNKRGSYLEVGPGHGLFLLQAMRSGSQDGYTGVDISASSLALTDKVVRAILPSARDRLRLIETDFLAQAGAEHIGGPYDILVMGEVLEHVEQPGPFLERLRSLAAPGAHLFVTTCVNAPAIDHICLFSTEAEVEKLITDAGLKIVRQLSVPYHGKTLKQSVAQKLPINVAYVLAP
jgi:2-polyprenyl-3-methyl-5-hydroxy-6-metoxy-1,4-benzoquinol methylase